MPALIVSRDRQQGVLDLYNFISGGEHPKMFCTLSTTLRFRKVVPHNDAYPGEIFSMIWAVDDSSAAVPGCDASLRGGRVEESRIMSETDIPSQPGSAPK